MTGSLDSESQLSLVLSAGAGDSSGEDLASFGSALLESLGVLVVDVIDTVSTEGANFLSSVSVGTLSHSLGRGFGSFGRGSSGFFRNNFSSFVIHCLLKPPVKVKMWNYLRRVIRHRRIILQISAWTGSDMHQPEAYRQRSRSHRVHKREPGSSAAS